MSASADTEAAEVQASSGVTPETLKEKLIEQLGATHVEVEDMSGITIRLCSSNQAA
jgi:hypothetical protein